MPASEDAPASTLELYKLSVEMADRTSARRMMTNSLFVTLHAALATVVSVVGTVHRRSQTNYDGSSLVLLAVVGVILSLAWWALLRYYRRLNGAKFQVINAMEEAFPVKPFSEEWAILHPSRNGDVDAIPEASWYHPLRKLRGVQHREATVVEQVVPFLFVVVYISLALRVATS